MSRKAGRMLLALGLLAALAISCAPAHATDIFDDKQTWLSVKETAEASSTGPQRDLWGYTAPCSWDGHEYQHGTWSDGFHCCAGSWQHQDEQEGGCGGSVHRRLLGADGYWKGGKKKWEWGKKKWGWGKKKWEGGWKKGGGGW